MVHGIQANGHSAKNFDAIWQNRLKKADTDGDGKISKDEFSAARPPNRKGSSTDEAFSRVDNNKDGYITEDEGHAAFQLRRGHQHTRAAHDPAQLADELFQKVDQDQDGKISQTELEAAIKGGNGSKLEDFFKTVDSDNDGSITKSELQDVLEQIFHLSKTSPNGGDSCQNYDRSGARQSTTAASTFSVTA